MLLVSALLPWSVTQRGVLQRGTRTIHVQGPPARDRPRKAPQPADEPVAHVAAFANHSFGLRTTSSTFDYTPAASCKPGVVFSKTDAGVQISPPEQQEQPPLDEQNVSSAAACEALCEHWPVRGACNAAEYHHPQLTPNVSVSTGLSSAGLKGEGLGRCILHRGCLERVRATHPKRVDVMHR